MPEKAPKERVEDQNYKNSWYSMTPNRLLVTLGVLRGEINCDVCIIGGGFTGISAAFELIQKGYSVTLLEAKTIVDSAPGKSGGQLLRGYQHSPGHLAKKYGTARAKMLCNLTLEGLALIVERIAKHEIKCDLKFGHVTTAINATQAAALKKRVDEWAKLGHIDLKYLSKKEIPAYINSQRYVGGIIDPKGAHFHPMNYALGITQTAQNAGCKIYDETPVLSVTPGSPAIVKTAHGTVKAKFVILSGYVRIPGLPRLNKKIIATSMPMFATQPLSDKISHKILPKNSAIVDSSDVMNYFKLASDNSLIFGSFGGNVDLRQRMAAIFPDLASVQIAHQWNSPMDFTLNYMPNFGQLSANIFYAHGYCGQGIILGNLAGKLIAEAVSGTAERFDVFARIGHTTIPGGDSLKQRILALAMAWYRLQDSLF